MGALEATTIRIGYHLGANDVPMAKRVGMVSLCLMLCVGVVVSVVLLVARKQIPHMFTSDPEVQREAERLMFLVSEGESVWVTVMLVQ